MTPNSKAYPEKSELVERYGILITYAQRCDDISFAHFLYQSQGQPRFYWESSQQHIAFAGIGNALEISGFGQHRFSQIERQVKDIFSTIEVLNAAVHPLALPRIFGGFAFSENTLSDYTWAGFDTALFVLPHYQLVSLDGEKWLTINVHVPVSELNPNTRAEIENALTERLANLRNKPTATIQQSTATVTRMHFPMAYETWAANINQLTQRMKLGELEKVVLARMCEVTFAQNINIEGALHYLAEHYAECYRFLFEPQPYHAFLGATPELLVTVTSNQVQTMALAGSIRRGSTQNEDQQYATTLLHDPKERHEHQLVIDQIQSRLEDITTSLDIAETGLYKLQNIQHLFTPICGTLKEPRGVLPLVEHLHPTPALGGIPRDKAMQAIEDCEPFPRGWYASPIGWIDHQMDGQFAVAIRSAVCQHERAWLYAGAGIVAESQPSKEWDETNLKLRPIREALGIADG